MLNMILTELKTFSFLKYACGRKIPKHGLSPRLRLNEKGSSSRLQEKTSASPTALSDNIKWQWIFTGT